DLDLTFGTNAKIQMIGTSKIFANEIIINNGETYIFDNSGSLNANYLFVKEGAILDFNRDGKCNVPQIEIGDNAHVTFCRLETNDIIIKKGSEVDFRKGTSNIYNTLTALGDYEDRITLNINQEHSINGHISQLTLEHCNYNGGYSVFFGKLNQNANVIINNCSFDNLVQHFRIGKNIANTINAHISGNTFSDCGLNGLVIVDHDTVFITQNNFNQINSTALILSYNKYTLVEDCQFYDTRNAIIVDSRQIETENPVPENAKIEIKNSRFESVETGIDALMGNIKTLYISDNIFSANKIGITATQFSEENNDFVIKQNRFTNNRDYGINLTNGIETVIAYNNFLVTDNSSTTDQLTGIYISQVTNPVILGNTIQGTNLLNPGPGIFMHSSNGQIRRNIITGHLNGIELGNSSPNIALNSITENKEYGLYVGSNSIPNLGNTSFDEEGYPLTGYNDISENGDCGLNAESEIFLSKAYIQLSKGCNTIADDRYGPSLQCDYTFLIDGYGVDDVIYAEYNYWGNHPIYGNDPSQRFGENVNVEYGEYWNEPCSYTPSTNYFLVKSYTGSVIDTVYSSGVLAFPLIEIEQAYSLSDKNYFSGNYSVANQGYSSIANNFGTTRLSLKAFTRLFQIQKLVNASSQEFTNLSNYYSSKLSGITDSLMIQVLLHLKDLCLVAEGEYVSAINRFETLANENPDTDLAFYLGLNALTTSLLLDSSSVLGKVSSKFIAYGTGDYNDKVKILFNKRRGINLESSTAQIPTKFELYQNYPNPFNPTTTIKFDLPKDGLVKLEIFDILGRKITTLVNEQRTAGSYEQVFDASSLASGVYVYKLQAGDFINSKKMILVK
ncbi:MAG: T9SS type A sorting domain-containing protein, partial [Ignavibacteria bacterium]|nr:T9SS type A sorting domain-containing protein [Ignavibacteria bacterium]